MTNPTVSDYLKYANLQMAAEAFLKDELTGEERYSGGNLITALTAGNKRSLKFTRLQAEAFAAQWTVVDQKANSSTGFSGTLFRSNKDNEALGIRKDELVLSFRSTEFIDDHARDNKATNDLEIDGTGFALGQIADMEAWYAQLTADPTKLSGKTYSVTGYSLGGHLATVFNQLRQAELQAGPPPATLDQVITFNGAGVGEIRNGTVTALVNRFVQLRRQAAGADGLAGLFQTATGKQAYHALRAALAVNLGVPTAAMRDAVANVFGALNEGDTLLQADRNLLLGANGALTRALKVAAVAAEIPGLKPGVEKTDQPTRVDDAIIDAERVDYQLAVITAQTEFDTRSRLTVGDLLSVFTSGGIAKGYGEPRLGNQIDAVGWEFSADRPIALVANSLWHYGQDVKLFIEDQPNVRNGVVAAVASASVAAGDFRPLVEGFATRDFGDDHSLVLIIDSLNVQNTLLQLLPEAQRSEAAATLSTILKNASWRKGVDGSNGGANAQGQAEGDVLENVVNALADLFLGPQAKADRLNGSSDGNTWAKADSSYTGADGQTYTGRDKLYATLKAITDSEIYKHMLPGTLTLAAAGVGLKDTARDDFGAYAALYSLSPFAFSTGTAAQAAVFDGSGLYAVWKAAAANKRQAATGLSGDLLDGGRECHWQAGMSRESRRWRHGDSTATAINNKAWRKAA
ncbi:MAG: hypothetical protein HYY97_00050 [Rhodocyclales bacterium]|nr:hypothetical protein [Rhodocyclales bacterium]